MEKNNQEPTVETLEELFQELDQIMKSLEQGEASLEESFQMYQNGMNLLKKCNEKIETVEQQVLVLEENGGVHEL